MRIGLLSDTHIPYRAPALTPAILEALREVDLILHAGDVDEPWALAPLAALAPVQAVSGNRHLLDRSSGGATLPAVVELEAAGFHLAMTHGYLGGLIGWLWKFREMLRHLAGHGDFPAHDAAIVRALLRRFPQADVIVFGHTHRYYQAYHGQTLVVNPGAALVTDYFNCHYPPSVALLALEPGARPTVTRILLPAG